MDSSPEKDTSPVEENGNGDIAPKALFAETQKGVFEMGTVITNPGLKRSESSEVLHLTLHQCARDGNPDMMGRLLASSTYKSGNIRKKINAKDDQGLSALHYAARYNHVPIVKLLVEHHADLNDVDQEGATPLHYAARYKRVRFKGSEEVTSVTSSVDNSVVLYLVSKGANVNVRDNYGCTPLHFAAMRGNELVTWELLQCKGINIEAVDKQQMTALHMAASHTEVEICRMLVEKGAELRCVDEDYATPLHYAAMDGCEKIAEMLLEAAEKKVGWVAVRSMVSDQDSQNNTPLHLAVENSAYEVAKLLLEKGGKAEANRTNEQFCTPLHLAAFTGDIRIVELLLENEARIDALDYSQSTALHKAAAHNHAEVCEYLIKKGARIDKHDKDNFTPLLLASCNGHSETISTLLNLGASIADMDKNDKNALFWAAEEDHVKALKVLLKKIKEANIEHLIDKGDRYNYAPIHIAAEKGFINTVRLLLEAGADVFAKNEEERTPLHLAAMKGKTSVVRLIIKHDRTTINDEDEDSNTPLHLAALSGHNKATVALLECGADIEARNCSLWTPLDCAAAKGFPKTVKILLENDAPVDPMDKSKTTPLHLACMKGHVQVVNILLKWNADVTLRTEKLNCLDLAIDNGHKDVAMALINSPKWKEALRCESRNLKDGVRTTPMRKLISKMPDVAEKVFFRCTTSNTNNRDDPNFRIEFNYEFLDDMYADWSIKESTDTVSMMSESIYDDENHLLSTAKPYTTDTGVLKKNHPLMLMVEGGQEDLLAHPLVTSLLKHKWNNFGRWLYYASLLIYCIFITFLTGYIATTKAPYLYYDATLGNCTASSCENIRTYCTLTNESSVAHTLFSEVGKYIIIALAAFNIIKELIQLMRSRLNYLGWENLIEWITYVSSILVVIDFNTCQQETGIREPWQWQLASVTILLGWLELVLFIRKFPRFGIFVVMFTDIFKTFLLFAPVFLLFIVAFALSFYVLFANQIRFSKAGSSLISTTVMMLGELEYTDLFYGIEDFTPGTDDYHKQRVYYDGISYVIFVIFVILMTILIMNLLIGLAVDDIKAVQDQAVLKRLAMQVELALNVESVLPQFIRRKFVVKCQYIEPNKAVRNPLRRLLNIESGFMSTQAIIKALNPDLDDLELVMENQEKLQNQVTLMRQRMKAIDQQSQRIGNMLQALLKAQNIEYTEDDVVEEDLGLFT